MRQSAKKMAALALAAVTAGACAKKQDDNEPSPTKAEKPVDPAPTPAPPAAPGVPTPAPVIPAPAPAPVTPPNTTDISLVGTLALSSLGLNGTCDGPFEIYGVTFDKKNPKSANVSVGADCNFTGDLLGFAGVPSGFFVRKGGETVCSITFEGDDAALTSVKKAASAQRAFAAGDLNLKIKMNAILGQCSAEIVTGEEAEFTEHVFVENDFTGAWGVRPLDDQDLVYDDSKDDDFASAQKEATSASVDEYGQVIYEEEGSAGLADDDDDDDSAAEFAEEAHPYFSESYWLQEVWTDNTLTQIKKYNLAAYQQCFEKDGSFVPLFVTSNTHDDAAIPGEVYDIKEALTSVDDFNGFTEIVLGNEFAAASIGKGDVDNNTFEAHLASFLDAELATLKAGAGDAAAGLPSDETLKGYLKAQLLSGLRGLGWQYQPYSWTEDGTEVEADFCTDSLGWYEGADGRPMELRFLCDDLAGILDVANRKEVSMSFLAAMRSGVETSCDLGIGVEIVANGYSGSDDGSFDEGASYDELRLFCGGQECFDENGNYAAYVPGHAGDFDVFAGPEGHFSFASYSSTESAIGGVYDIAENANYEEDGDVLGEADDADDGDAALDVTEEKTSCLTSSSYSDDWSLMSDDTGAFIRTAAYVVSSSSYYDECSQVFDKPMYEESYAEDDSGEGSTDVDFGYDPPPPPPDAPNEGLDLVQDEVVYDAPQPTTEVIDDYAYNDQYASSNVWAAIWVKLVDVAAIDPEVDEELPTN